MKEREEYNKKLLKLLEEYLSTHQDCRFIQALWNLKIIDREPIWNPGEVNPPLDRFYEEPIDTFNRISHVQYFNS